jgi:uncharacterized protein YegP (UPF0339 family)
LLFGDSIMKTSLVALALLAALAAPALTACTEVDPIDASIISEDLKFRPRFELWQQNDGHHVFQFVSADGEVLLDSTLYSTRTSALAGLTELLAAGSQRSRYTVVTDELGAHLELRSTSHELLGASPHYVDAAAATRALPRTIASVAAYPRHWDGGAGARFELTVDADGKHGFELLAADGTVALHSQRYDSLAAALGGAFSVVDNGVTAGRYDVLPLASGGYYFTLISSNGRVIATSEIFASKLAAEHARDAIVAFLPGVSLL